MKGLYAIVPLVLMVAFAGIYMRFEKNYLAGQARKATDAAALVAQEEARKRELEAQAAGEGKRKAEEKARADAERKAKQREEQLKIDEEIRSDTEQALAELARTRAELEGTRAELTAAREQREKLEAGTFDLAAAVERMKIDRRNAELELQRATEMLAARTEASALVEVPLFPAPQSPPKKQ